MNVSVCCVQNESEIGTKHYNYDSVYIHHYYRCRLCDDSLPSPEYVDLLWLLSWILQLCLYNNIVTDPSATMVVNAQDGLVLCLSNFTK